MNAWPSFESGPIASEHCALASAKVTRGSRSKVKKGVDIKAAAAAKFIVPVSTLGKHYKDSERKIGGGRKQEISEEFETDMAKYKEVCAVYGEGITRSETLELVKEYVEHSKWKTRWRNNKPSDDWLNLFFKRHPDLRIRNGKQLSNQRVRGADTFIVNSFYKDLQKLYIKEKKTEESCRYIYNCDESSFSDDPNYVRVIAKKCNKRVSKNIAGTGTTNANVLACEAADGTKMPPFIIFSGTYVWSTWIPKDDYPGTAFLHTGLFPADTSKFPEEAYNPIKLQRFKAIEKDKALKDLYGTLIHLGLLFRQLSFILLKKKDNIDEILGTPLPEEGQPGCSSWTAEDCVQHPTKSESFIQYKLTENVLKSTPKVSRKRKKISDQKGEILISVKDVKPEEKKE
ncbi:hypothetical protein PR048_019487 [Dryococelus australis]|uniref:HTH CENPB-type domain-containing protein n=1 Tax=Dryococelus australis TaxID=614101 RepID=A0ABQ9H3Y7_9NEOP|nr:hypothetical protein PR048_019487 [Dryococelus australis]